MTKWLPDGTRERLAMALFPRSIVNFTGRGDYVLSDFLPADWRQDSRKHKVRQAVYIETDWISDAKDGSDTLEELEWVMRIRAADPDQVPGAICCRATLELGAALEPVLAKLAVNPLVRSVRSHFAYDPAFEFLSPRGNALLSPEVRAAAALLPKHNLMLEAWVMHPQISQLVDFAQALPELRIILNHVASPLGFGREAGPAASTTVFKAWSAGLRRLAVLPNIVAVKLSGLCMPCSGLDWHKRKVRPTVDEVVEQLQPWIKEAISIFGIERCMFASNFPMDKVTVGYTVLWNAYKRIVADLPPADRVRLFHDNAQKLYNLPAAPSAAAS
eukprot:TRINITY_DN3192_c0_g1_i2.p1 TRINITY_DN3192_c0_g1~~TRINITY_DN3192_c0_g1_i2.p1  ORF type:complete len:373 (-),score=75.29 TRINITY_DN3192_c0_g1_i2:35-1024(-)